MIKRLHTAAIGVALVLSATSAAQAGPYYGFDGRTYGEPATAPNWGRPESKGPKLADDKGAPRKCLTTAVHAVLDQIEARFGPVKVISTCRPGARIAGSGRISRHASGNAVDFEAGSRKGAIINWLVANHKTGGTMTYPDMSHIHVDVGQHFVSLAGGRKYASRSTRSSGRRYADSGRATIAIMRAPMTRAHAPMAARAVTFARCPTSVARATVGSRGTVVRERATTPAGTPQCTEASRRPPEFGCRRSQIGVSGRSVRHPFSFPAGAPLRVRTCCANRRLAAPTRRKFAAIWRRPAVARI